MVIKQRRAEEKTAKFEPPMIIDMHAHLNEPGTTKWANQQGIDRTVLMSGPDDNMAVLNFCKESGGRFIPFCRLKLSDVKRACEDVRKFAQIGFRGVKFQPMTDHFLPHEERLYPLWETIEKLGIPITSHAGAVKYEKHRVNLSNPSGWSQIAWDFPKMRIIIAHMGGNYHFEALTIAEACPSVFLDTAHLQYFCARMLPQVRPAELVERAIKYAGVRKVLFASEGMTPKFVIDSLNIDLEERKYIFWKNALSVLGEKDV